MANRKITLGAVNTYGYATRRIVNLDAEKAAGGMPAVMAKAVSILETVDIDKPGDEPLFVLTVRKNGEVKQETPKELAFHLTGVSPWGFPEGVNPYDANKYPNTDAGNAQLFVDSMGRGRLLYNASRDLMMHWDGLRWTPDDRKGTEAKAVYDEWITRMYNAVNCIDGNKALKETWEKRVNKLARQSDAIKQSYQHLIKVHYQDFDRSKSKINLLNGVYDLDTGVFVEGHDPADMMTQLANVVYDPEAKCPRWDRFISEIFEGDSGKIRYAAQWFGYSLSGYTNKECYTICWGPTGRNGKGTLAETLRSIMGDYAMVSNYHLICDDWDSSKNSDEFARMEGKRFLSINEMPYNKAINAANLKSLIGNDTQMAMRKYETPFEFKPTVKLTLYPNDKPRINDRVMFTSGRMVMLVLTHHFGADEQDTTLKETLVTPENKSGILNWLIAGWRDFKKTGDFAISDTMKKDLAEYFSEDDFISSWMLDSLVDTGDKADLLTGPILYSSYKEYCQGNGNVPLGRSEFFKQLRARGLLVRTSHSDNCIRGMRQRDPQEARVYSPRLDMGMAAAAGLKNGLEPAEEPAEEYTEADQMDLPF